MLAAFLRFRISEKHQELSQEEPKKPKKKKELRVRWNLLSTNNEIADRTKQEVETSAASCPDDFVKKWSVLLDPLEPPAPPGGGGLTLVTAALLVFHGWGTWNTNRRRLDRKEKS